MRGKFFSYLRVSTDRQGERGHGLDAQRKAVADYLNGGAWELLGEFVEVESGKRNGRPKLAEALASCKKHRARLVHCEAGPALAQRRFHRHADGRQG
jgi:DNA invertase Pin-like site-specific DNA recombinase